MTTAHKLRFAALLLVLGCTIGCDQTTKHVARATLKQVGSITVFHGFGELRLAENPGAFLSLGIALPASVRRVVFTLGAGAGLVGLFGYLAGRTRLSGMAFAGLALVMAGGMSNCIDRIVRGGLVTDFITLRFGPLHTGIFNVADLVVMVGVGLLAFAFWKRERSIAGRPPTAGRRSGP
jgi:signal peptidase II